jgi:hypothetical protein
VLQLAEPLEPLLGVCIVQRRMVVPRHEIAERAQTGRNLVEHGSLGRARNVLIEPRHTKAWGAPDRPAIGRDLA